MREKHLETAEKTIVILGKGAAMGDDFAKEECSSLTVKRGKTESRPLLKVMDSLFLSASYLSSAVIRDMNTNPISFPSHAGL